MKRDLDLVRKILIHFEEKTDWKNEKDLKLSGFQDKDVSYHLDIIYEAGLLNSEPILSKQGRVIDTIPFRLTWEGHEFLDNIREESTFNKIKSIIVIKAEISHLT